MRDLGGVRVRHPLHNLRELLLRLRVAQVPARRRRHVVLQVAARRVAERNHHGVLHVVHRQQVDDVGVVQLRQAGDLGDDAVGVCGGHGAAFGQELERHALVRHIMLPQPHRAKPAHPQQPRHAVRPNHAASLFTPSAAAVCAVYSTPATATAAAAAILHVGCGGGGGRGSGSGSSGSS